MVVGDNFVGDVLVAAQRRIEIAEQDFVFQPVLVQDAGQGKRPHDILRVMVEHPAPRPLGCGHLLLEGFQHRLGLLRCAAGGEQLADIFEPLMPFDAQGADFLGGEGLERVNTQGRPEDDLVQVAVGEALRIGVTELLMGMKRALQVGQHQAAQVAVVDFLGPTVVAGALGQEIAEREFQPGAAAHTALQVRVEERQAPILPRTVHEDDLQVGVVTNLLKLVAEAQIAAGEDDGEAVLDGPAVHDGRPTADHPLRVMDDNQPFVSQRVQLFQRPSFDHSSAPFLRRWRLGLDSSSPLRLTQMR